MLFAQAEQAVETFESISAKEGVFAALLAAVLIFVGFVFWKLGNAFLHNANQSDERMACAVESIAVSNDKIGDIALAIESKLDGLGTDMGKLKASLVLAMAAVKEEDSKVRHRLIDEARETIKLT